MATFTGTNGNDSLIGTAVDDSFQPLLGVDWVGGGAGFDLLTVNYAALLGITATIGAESATAFSGTIGNALLPAANLVAFAGIEGLALTFSPGNDTLAIDAAPLAAGATLTLDAGAGFDLLRIDFSALPGTVFSQGVNFLVTSNRGSFAGWDQFEIVLGPGTNEVTMQTGADVVRALGGNDTILTGPGNDTIWSIGSADVVNGGSGTDLWHGDYSAWSSTLGFAYDTSAGQGYVTNGTTLANIEGGSIVTGSADDSFLLMGLGPFHVDGGAGEDWLTWDDTGDLGFPYDAEFRNGGNGSFAGRVAAADFLDIERINAALGDGDNYAFVDAAPLAAGATVNLSGGLGFDTLAVDFSALAGTSFLVGADGSVAANRGTWLGFEQFAVALGGGANALTTGAADDVIWSAGGIDTIDGGAGADTWYADYSAAAAPLAFVWNPATGGATLSNGTRAFGVEAGVVLSGAGNDSFVLSGLAPWDVDGGAGVDSLSRNDAGLIGANRDHFVFSGDGAFHGVLGNGGFGGIEQIDATLADDDDRVWVEPLALLSGGSLTLNGGLGADLLMLDLSLMPGSVISLDGAGVLGGNRGTYRGFESVWIGLGPGTNSVTLGSGNDTVEAGLGGANLIATGAGDDLVLGGPGAETVAGGAGFDTFEVRGAMAGYTIARDGLGGYILTDIDPANGDDGQDRLSAVEQVRFADGVAALPDYAVGLELTGTAGADSLTGTPWDDRLSGLAGNDTLSGGDGDDWLSGGPGDDRLTGGGGADTVDYGDAAAAVKVNLAIVGLAQATGGGGTDTLADPIENLAGSAFADTLTGNALANRIAGGAGNDTLDGGAGADTLLGGLGNDTYVVDNVADVVSEAPGEGTDLVRAALAYALPDNVENLTLTGTLGLAGAGNAAANLITGNAGANLLTGLAGNDTLDGGAGADTLVGGLGNDSYKVDNAADVVLELPGEGTDAVTAAVTYTLAANVENLVLSGTLGNSGTGNELANAITGNGGANRLFGLAGNDTLDGGAGADTMTGGAGNDSYKVDNALDVVVELPGEGTDAVTATVTFALAAEVENLTLSGTLAINGTGNALANGLTGNAAANLLTGLDGNDTLDGGLGADTLVGGTGNDTYKVDNAADLVVEAPGEGTDLVSATISFVLPDNVENLTLTGTLALAGTGNAAANSLLGNSGANVLRGLDGNDTIGGGSGNDTLHGGAGADSLTGGTGADLFVFDLHESAANRDAILDFAHLSDKLGFDRAVFTELGGQPAGALAASQFVLGTAATTAQHHFIYAQTSGSLYYDPDGLGGAAQVLVAMLTTRPVLSAADFLLL